MRTKKMWEMTWPEVQEAIDNDMGVMLPVGAIEQHGCHLPLVTDTIIPTRLCTEIAENTNMIVAAPISYGTYSRPQSGGGQGFVGTTSVTGITLVHQVEDILREFLRHGFKKIVIFNWHMENSNFLYEAAYRATERGTRMDVKVVVMETPFDSFDDETMVSQAGGWSMRLCLKLRSYCTSRRNWCTWSALSTVKWKIRYSTMCFRSNRVSQRRAAVCGNRH